MGRVKVVVLLVLVWVEVIRFLFESMIGMV